MASLTKSSANLQELSFDFEAKAGVMDEGPEKQVLDLKKVELTQKLEELRETQSKVKVTLAQVKFYLKDISQNKKADL